MKVLYGLAFIPLYLGWVIHRTFIKKDIKRHKSDLYGLTFFISAWIVIYYFLFFF